MDQNYNSTMQDKRNQLGVVERHTYHGPNIKSVSGCAI